MCINNTNMEHILYPLHILYHQAVQVTSKYMLSFQEYDFLVFGKTYTCNTVLALSSRIILYNNTLLQGIIYFSEFGDEIIN